MYIYSNKRIRLYIHQKMMCVFKVMCVLRRQKLLEVWCLMFNKFTFIHLKKCKL